MAKLTLVLLIVCSGVGCIGVEPTAIEPDVGGMYDPEPTSAPAPTQPSKPVAPEQSKPIETTSQPAVQPSPAAKQAPSMGEPVAAVPPVVEPAAKPEQPSEKAPEACNGMACSRPDVESQIAPEPTPAPEMTPPIVLAPAQPTPEPAPVTPVIVPVVPAPVQPIVCQPDVCEDPYYPCYPPQTGALEPPYTDAGSWSRTLTLHSVTDQDLVRLPFMFRKTPRITMKVETDLPPDDAFYACNGDSYDDGSSCGAGTGWMRHKGCLIIASEFTVTCPIGAFSNGNGTLNLLFHQPPVDGELKTATRCEYTVAVSWH